MYYLIIIIIIIIIRYLAGKNLELNYATSVKVKRNINPINITKTIHVGDNKWLLRYG